MVTTDGVVVVDDVVRGLHGRAVGGEVNDAVTAGEGRHDLTVIGGVNHHGMGGERIVTGAWG